MRKLVNLVLPPRLGSSYRWLLASSWVSNIGDGLALAAGPLLVASQTSDPILVAVAALLQRLPWLLFGLYAGAIADRVDRRILVVVVDLIRAGVLALLGAAVLTGQVNITIVLIAMFLLGTAETFADTTTTTLLPMLVAKRDLGIANARIQTGFVTFNQLLGPPIGAFLFALGMAWPFVTQAVFVAFSALLVAKIVTPRGSVRDLGHTHIRRDIVDGIRWLMNHPAVRTLALVILAFNVTWGAAWSVLVLYSTIHLGMGEIGFGLLTSAAAAGGLVSTVGYGWLERRVPLATLMRACLSLEVLIHLGLALTTVSWVAMAIMFVFGAYAFVWVTISQAVRQRAVPAEFQGRVASVYMVGVFAGIVGGQALGGVIADRFGLAAPFWFAFFGAGLTLALIWRQLGHIAHADEEMQRPTVSGE